MEAGPSLWTGPVGLLRGTISHTVPGGDGLVVVGVQPLLRPPVKRHEHAPHLLAGRRARLHRGEERAVVALPITSTRSPP